MRNTPQKKVSRRDAIKLIGAAAGAAALANLPSKWSKPELVSGVLPAHAQTSCAAVTFEILTLSPNNIDGITAGIITGPSPDFSSGDGGTGSIVGWSCQSGCLAFYLELSTATDASIRITTLSHTFTIVLNAGYTRADFLIDLGSGVYALDFAPSSFACSWPLLP